MASTDLQSCHNSVSRDITIFTPLCMSLSPGRYMYKWAQMTPFQGNPVMDKHLIKGVGGGRGLGGGDRDSPFRSKHFTNFSQGLLIIFQFLCRNHLESLL